MNTCILNHAQFPPLIAACALCCPDPEFARRVFISNRSSILTQKWRKYRVFIKYLVFPLNVVICLNSASSAAAMVFDLPFKIFEITQYLMTLCRTVSIKLVYLDKRKPTNMAMRKHNAGLTGRT